MIRFPQKHRKLWIAGTCVLAITAIAPPSAQAIFGSIGDIAIIAKLSEQLAQQVQMVSNLRQQVTQLTQTYMLAKLQAKQFTNKNYWRVVGSQVMQDQASDLYGEMRGWNQAINTSPQGAQAAWRSATLPLNAGDFLRHESLGASSHLAGLASLEMVDGAAAPCMGAIASYRQQQATNANAVALLEQTQLDSADSANTEIQQLNLLNASEAQKTREMHSQGALHTCLATQQLIANTFQRNQIADALNTYGKAATKAATTNSSYTGGGDTVRNYEMP